MITSTEISSIRSATARGPHRDELAEAIIANVVDDDLFAAVIDR